MLGHIREISEKTIWLAGKEEPRSCIRCIWPASLFFHLNAFLPLYWSEHSKLCLSTALSVLAFLKAGDSSGELCYCCCRRFCPCFQRETATVVRACLLSDATIHSLVHNLPCVLPENYGHYSFMSGHELQYLRDLYTQTPCCCYQKSRNPW